MLIQGAMQDGQNFLSKTTVRVSAQPQEETTRIERDKQERANQKLQQATGDPAAVYTPSSEKDYEGKKLSPRQKTIAKLQNRIMKIQDKMVEVKNDDSLTANEKKEQLKKLDEQLAPLLERKQNLDAEELEKFKAQKEKEAKAKESAAEKPVQQSASEQTPGEADVPIEAPALDAGALAHAGASFDRADAALSLSRRFDAKATFWQHDLDDFIRHQTRPVSNPPPDPKIVARRRDEIYAAKRTADRLEVASADAVKEGGEALKEAEKSSGALPPKPNDLATEENDIRRGPSNAIGNAPAAKSAGTSSQSE